MKELNRDTPKRKIYFSLSFILLLSGLLSWVPYCVFNIEQPYGMLTFILNPIGAVLGIASTHKLITISNVMMVFSFIPVMVFVFLTRGYIPM